MFLSNLSIKRPIFTTMVMTAFVVLGIFAFRRLNVDEFPNVDFPFVVISTQWPGAGPESVESDVTKKIEEAVNPISGVKQISSQSLEGVSSVVIQFNLNIKATDAANDVREKLSRVRSELPPDIKEPVIERLDPAATPILSLTLSSDTLTLRDLTELADDTLRKRLENVPGVGKVTLVGGQKREVEVLLDPARLFAQGFTPGDIINALKAGNLDLPAGRLERGTGEVLIRVAGRFRRVADFQDLPVRAVSGAVVRLGDVATIKDGEEERRSTSFMASGSGKDAPQIRPAVALEIRKQSGANTVSVADAVMERLEEMRGQIPAGAKLDVATNNSVFIRASLKQVEEDLFLGALLTVFIVFLFLHSWRSTVITSLTLPISVIGAFTAVWAAGFTLNQLTLMALTLAIGLLIDDAIVVRENIVRHAQMGKDHVRAAREGTEEIGLAVLATTLSIVAVFVPVAFMGGIVGRFFFQFGITVSVAVLLSLFVSFTLDPMMSAVWPDPTHGEDTPHGPIGRAVQRFNAAFDRLSLRYQDLVRWALTHRKSTLLLTLGVFIATLALGPLIGFAFFPDVDRGEFVVMVRTPVGSSLSYTEQRTREVIRALHKDPDVAYTYSTIGAGTTGAVTEGNIYVKLQPRKKRLRDIHLVRPDARERLQNLVDVSTALVDAGGVGGPMAPLQISVKGTDLKILDQVARQVLKAVAATPGAVDVQIGQENRKPELRLFIDRQRAADLGVNVSDVAQTLRALIAGEQAGNYEDDQARTHVVRVRLPQELRSGREDLSRLLVAGAPRGDGARQLISVDQVARLTENVGPSKINRIDLAREVRITGNIEGRPLGDVSRDIKAAVDQLQLPPGYLVDLGGQSKDLQETLGYVLESLILAIIFIYLVLASQFESFLQPLAIMFSLPFSLVGVFLAMLVTRGNMNIMAMIGLIMLMGLVTKNAILLVDNANQRRAEGMNRLEALVTAGQVRLRPIVMTTLAMIGGMLPLAMALGEGSEFRSPMARAVIGGLISSTLLTLVVVPVVYTYLDGLGTWIVRKIVPESPPEPRPPHAGLGDKDAPEG